MSNVSLDSRIFGKLLLFFLMAYCFGMNVAFGQAQSEQQASEETSIKGLQLLRSTSKDSRFNRLGINLGYVDQDTRPGNGKYLCGVLKRGEAIEAGGRIIKALTSLSDASLKKIRLKYIVLCGRVLAGGRRVGGIPVPPLSLVMLEVGETSVDASYVKRIFLHELYHFIEYRFNVFKDRLWLKNFGAGYTNGYSAQSAQSRIGSGKKGFLNAYSETYPHEDRAELFVNLLLTPEKVIKHIRSVNDQLLKEKSQYLA